MATTQFRQDGHPVEHALAAFIRTRTDDKGWRNADLARESGLSRQQVSKYLNDERDRLPRLPDKATLAGFAKAFKVPEEFLLGKAIEALDLGYVSGDFINSVSTARDDELLAEIGRRLAERGEGRADRSAPSTDAGGPGADLLDLGEGRQARRQRLLEDAQPGEVAAYDDGSPLPGDESDPEPGPDND